MPLKLLNGSHYMGGALRARLYVAANSRADAARMVASCFESVPTQVEREMKTYWAPCWGSSMDGITPERGVWLQLSHHARPLRLWVAE